MSWPQAGGAVTGPQTKEVLCFISRHLVSVRGSWLGQTFLLGPVIPHCLNEDGEKLLLLFPQQWTLQTPPLLDLRDHHRNVK